MKASSLQIEKYQKTIKKKDALVIENKAKILKIESYLLDKSKRLRKMDKYYIE